MFTSTEINDALSLSDIDLQRECLELLSYDEAKRLQILPYKRLPSANPNGLGEVAVALPNSARPQMADPGFIDRLSRRLRAERVRVGYLTDTDFIYIIDRAYLGMGSTASQEFNATTPGGTPPGFQGSPTAADTTVVLDAVEESASQALVSDIITAAIVERGTDIHIEYDGRLNVSIVRIRVDGVLRPMATYQIGLDGHRQVINVIKAMAALDGATRLRPQDGRFAYEYSGREIEVRTAIAPTVDDAEKAVLRVLDTSAAPDDIKKIGFSPEVLEKYQSCYRKSSGLVIVTGSTGSGKTTTLRATVEDVISPELHVVTVEDPVEHRIQGATQIQINTTAGLTWTTVLRSILRMDPDIIFIGEIRDKDTAKIAVEASLTGHLVLTTLHTSSAPGAVTRLIEMGVEPYLLGSALSGVLAQKLIRKVCTSCMETDETANQELARAIEGVDLSAINFKKGAGCPACSRTGYRGRTAIHEMFAISEPMRDIIGAGHTGDQLKVAARANGWEPISQDALTKAIAGTTSAREILRVIA